MKIVQKELAIRILLIAATASSLNAYALSAKELINQARSYLNNNLLNLQDQDIDDWINEIKLVARQERLDAQIILKTLHTMISDDCSYHKENIGTTKDPFTRKVCVWAFGIAAATYALSYSAYRILWKPARDEMHALFAKYGVAQAPRGWNQGVPCAIGNAEGEDYYRLLALRDQNMLYGPLIVTPAFLGIIPVAIGGIELYRYHYGDPRHQERYEKLCTVKEYLEKEIE